MLGLTKDLLTPIDYLSPTRRREIKKYSDLEKYSFVTWTDKGLFLSDANDEIYDITNLFQEAFETSQIETLAREIFDIVRLDRSKVYTLASFTTSNNADAVYGALHTLTKNNHLQRVDAYNGIARWVTT